MRHPEEILIIRNDSKDHLPTPSPPQDTTPPTVQMVAPTDGATVGSTTTITASASDNVGVARVDFKVDGVVVGSAAGTTPPTALQIAQEKAFQLTSTAENSTKSWWTQYRTIQDLSDGHGYTGGIAGFASADGDMLDLVKNYFLPTNPSSPLSSYVTGLQACATTGPGAGASSAATTNLGSGFITAWQNEADNNLSFQAAQRAYRYDKYWVPAYNAAVADGLSYLGLALYYDTMIQHRAGVANSNDGSFDDIRSRTGGTSTGFGKTTNGTGSTGSSADKIAVSSFVAPANGKIVSGHFRGWVTAGSANHARLVLYSNSGGGPGTLLATSDEIAISNTTEQILNVTFSGSDQYNVTSGTTYWLGIMWSDPGSGTFTYSRDDTSNLALAITGFSYPSAPSTFGSGNLQSGKLDVWVDLSNSTTVPPSTGGNETTWLNSFLSVRSAVLTAWGQNPSDGRISMFTNLLNTGNMTLTCPFSWSVHSIAFALSSDPVPFGFVSNYSYVWNSSTVANGSHLISAVAYDAAGNSAETPTISVTVSNADTAPPTAPTGLSGSAPAYNLANLSWTASTDNVAVTGYNVLRNGVIVGKTTSLSYQDTNLVGNTTYSYKVQAYDAAGNLSAYSSTVSVTTPAPPPPSDSTPPTVSITAPSNGATVSGQISITATAADNVGVASVDFKIDGVLLSRDPSSPYSASWNTTGATNGGHTISATAYDAAGNNTTASITVTVSNGTSSAGQPTDIFGPLFTVMAPFAKPGTTTSPQNEYITAAQADPMYAPYFFMQNGAVTFKAPVGGVHSANSSYPRCESREMADLNFNGAAWSNSSGVHTLEVTEAVEHLPAVKSQVVCAQIHDAANDVIEIMGCGLNHNPIAIVVRFNGVEQATPLKDGYVLGTFFNLKVVATAGTIDIYYNGTLTHHFSRTGSGWYFKAGCYTQSNPTKGDSPTDYGQVKISAIKITHA